MARMLFLDDDNDLRSAMSDLLGALGHEAVCARSLKEMQAMHDEVLACDLALLDINLGPNEPSGIDAYDWLQDEGFSGKVTFLTGHGRFLPEVRSRTGADGTVVPMLEKPIDVKRLERMLSVAAS